MWLLLATVPRADQFTSGVVVGELYKGTFRSQHSERHLDNIEKRVLATVSVLPFDVAIARLWGQLQADLEISGNLFADADLRIAATAILTTWSWSTENQRHFRRVPGLKLRPVRIRRARPAGRRPPPARPGLG